MRESGALEQGAHNVFLFIAPIDPDISDWTGEDEIIIAKQRHGMVGSCLQLTTTDSWCSRDAMNRELRDLQRVGGVQNFENSALLDETAGGQFDSMPGSALKANS